MALLNIVQDLDENLEVNCHTVDTIEHCQTLLKNTESNFKILSLNIRSFQHNFDNFAVMLQRTTISFDVIIFTECWLTDGSIIDPLPGYNAYRTTVQQNKNGGVICFVKSNYKTVAFEPTILDADRLLITIDDKVAILGIYRSPSFSNLEPFLNSLETLLSSLANKQSLIVTGDINIDICNTTNSQSSEYLCLMSCHGLLPAITSPTRDKACLDHIFIKCHNKCFGVVCKSSITDHDIVLANISSRKPPTGTAKRSISKTDTEAVIADLNSVDWSVITNDTNVNTATTEFTNIVTSTVDKHTRNVKIGRKLACIKPWITPGLIRCMIHRDKLHNDCKSNPDDPVRNKIYTRYRNFFSKLLSRLRSDYNNQQIIENKDNPKNLWKAIKSIGHIYPKSNETSQLLSPNREKETLNSCNSHFTSVGTRLADKILEKLNLSHESLINTYTSDASNPHSLFLEPTDAYEIIKIISDLKVDSAPGPDKISVILIKRALKSLLVPMMHIFNLSLETGTFPECWKIAGVSPIYKSGPKHVPDNYRPIALLSSVSKILERIVNSRLISFIDKNHLISDNQFGFRRNRSTEDAATLLVDCVASHIEKNEKCLAIFLDLAKAFDTVSTGLLLKKLECIGIRGICLDWFKSYLTNRKQYTKVSSFTSDQLPIDFGVPQGSVLGPTLFIVYINDILNLSVNNAEIITYADDTAVIFHGKSWEHVHSLADEGLSLIANNLDRNLLTLNGSKTKYIVFSKTAASNPPEHLKLKLHHCSSNTSTSSCDCPPLERTSYIKYLGILIDDHLTFKQHISNLSGRIRKLIHTMRRLRDCLPTDTLQQVYLALCQSIIQYCISVWGSAGKTYLIEAERAQRALLKVTFKKPYRFSTDLLYRETKVLRVRQLFILSACTKTHKSIKTRLDYATIINKRNYRIPTPDSTSLLARRSPAYSLINTYNKVCKLCEIKNTTSFGCKKIVKEILHNTGYDDSEQLI